MKRRLTPTEHQEQCTVIAWADLQRDKRYSLLYAIPNAGKRSKTVGAEMKKEGMRTGMLDLCLPVSVHPYPALYAEMKVGDNRPSTEQRIMAKRLAETGNAVCLCYSADDMILTLQEYIAEKSILSFWWDGDKRRENELFKLANQK